MYVHAAIKEKAFDENVTRFYLETYSMSGVVVPLDLDGATNKRTVGHQSFVSAKARLLDLIDDHQWLI